MYYSSAYCIVELSELGTLNIGQTYGSATSQRPPKFVAIAEVAEESQLGLAVGPRLVRDWSATDQGLVADRSATGRRLRWDLFVTLCNWSPTGQGPVPDQLPIGGRPSQLKIAIKKKNIYYIF